jgi:hypothetical protein
MQIIRNGFQKSEYSGIDHDPQLDKRVEIKSRAMIDEQRETTAIGIDNSSRSCWKYPVFNHRPEGGTASKSPKDVFDLEMNAGRVVKTENSLRTALFRSGSQCFL